MIDVEHYKKILIDRQTVLNKRLHKIEDLLDDPKDQDFADGAIEHEQDEVLESQGNAGLAELAKIDAALKRIEIGNYGTCVICEEPISKERLDAVPHAAKCRNCMNK